VRCIFRPILGARRGQGAGRISRPLRASSMDQSDLLDYGRFDRCGEISAVSFLFFAAPVASRSFSDNRKKRPLRCGIRISHLGESHPRSPRSGTPSPFPSTRAAIAALRALADRIANSLPCHDTREQVPKRLTDVFDENLLQHFDVERFLIDHMIRCDREAL